MAGIGAARTDREKIIEIVTDRYVPGVTDKQPRQAISKIVEYPWAGTRAEDEPGVKVKVPRPTEALQLPLIAPHRHEAKRVFNVRFGQQSTLAAIDKNEPHRLIQGSVGDGKFYPRDAVVDGLACRLRHIQQQANGPIRFLTSTERVDSKVRQGRDAKGPVGVSPGEFELDRPRHGIRARRGGAII